MQIEWITVDGQEKVLLKFQEYHSLELLRRWAETVTLPRNGRQYKILATTLASAPDSYVHAPFLHVYIAEVEAIDISA